MKHSFLALFVLAVSADCWAPPMNGNGAPTPVWRPRTQPQECTPVDARTGNPALAEHWATPRDQDSIGWCYSFAGADVLTSVLGTPVSASELSYAYNHGVAGNPISNFFHGLFSGGDSATIEGGFIGSVLRHAKRNGACEESRLPSESSMVSAYGTQIVTALQHLSAVRDRITQNNMTKAAFVDCVECNSVIAGQGVQEFFPGLTADVFYDVIRANSNKDINQQLFALSQRYCGQDRLRVPDNIRFRSASAGSNNHRALFRALDVALGQGSVAGISGNARMYDKDAGMFSGHATVVVARRFEHGKCQYLVRNSWGRGCGGYNHNNLRAEDCDAQGGSIWMDEEHLKRYVMTVNYAERSE